MGMLAQALSGAAGGFAQGYGEALKMDMQSQASQRLEAARQAHDEHMAELRNTQDNARLDKTQAFERERDATKEAGQGSGNFDPVTGREYSKLQWGSVRDTEEGKKAVGSGMLQKPMTPEQQAEHEARMAGYSNSAAMISKQTKELDAEIKDKAASKEAIAKASEDLNSAIDSGDQQEINKAQAKMSIALKQVPKMGVERDTAATNMQINAIEKAAELAGKDKYEDANDVLSKAGMSPAYEQKISPITGEPLLDEAGNAQWSRRSPSPQAGGGGSSPAFPGNKLNKTAPGEERKGAIALPKPPASEDKDWADKAAQASTEYKKQRAIEAGNRGIDKEISSITDYSAKYAELFGSPPPSTMTEMDIKRKVNFTLAAGKK